jgi:hypothetical protein
MFQIAAKVTEAELAYERFTDCGRKFGITGEIGEILVCQKLDLLMVKDPRSEGYDAIDRRGYRIQIKTRRGEKTELPKETGRLSRFSKHKCDYALMVILNREYQIAEIWQAQMARLNPMIMRHTGRNPTIRQFKKVGRKIYSC